MGVTIHYQGQLSGSDQYEPVMSLIKDFAEARGWPATPVSEQSTQLLRVIDEQDVDYLGPTKGVELRPHPDAEPLRFEFDDTLFMQDYCKTQFAGADAHIEVLGLFKALEPLFANLAVEDEGEYWDLGDRDVLENHINTINGLIAEERENNPSASGPIRLETGRIADIFTSSPESPPKAKAGSFLSRLFKRT